MKQMVRKHFSLLPDQETTPFEVYRNRLARSRDI